MSPDEIPVEISSSFPPSANLPLAQQRKNTSDPMTCDDCSRSAEYTFTAAYDWNRAAVHPLIACYPAPMARACRIHLLERIDADLRAPFPTSQYVLAVRQASR